MSTAIRGTDELTGTVKSFISALAAEVWNPTMLMTKKQLLDALLKASDRVVGEVKQASVHV